MDELMKVHGTRLIRRASPEGESDAKLIAYECIINGIEGIIWAEEAEDKLARTDCSKLSDFSAILDVLLSVALPRSSFS